MEGGWFVNSVPIITADWEAPGAEWTVPVGGGGRLIKLGPLPVSFQLQAYKNVLHPDGTAPGRSGSR
jgi:hypothetical protein